MNKILYKNPVMSAIVINLFTLLLLIYSINKRLLVFIYIMPFFTGVINRKIMDNGEDITTKKKVIIIFSFLLILTIYLFYSYNVTRLRYS
ncbi:MULTISPECIES: hypothetical protein [Clostridium]|uniref:hypothetical protein n=1 Tax=Clostridium TaxID=1485 RepID=UPI00189AC70B|nr:MULTISPECIES: hypothetical protein [Clostridium]MDI9215827.1 hypothetical protein [Clostridium tertium]